MMMMVKKRAGKSENIYSMISGPPVEEAITAILMIIRADPQEAVSSCRYDKKNSTFFSKSAGSNGLVI